MEATVNRKVTLWIQDTYEVPDNTTEEDLERMDKTGELDAYFKERDMFKFMEAGDDLEQIGENEYNIV